MALVSVWLCFGVVAAQDAPIGGREEVAISDRGRVEMHVDDVDLSTVLRLLSVQSRRNIVASPDVTGTVTASLFDVTFEEALEAILVANGAGYRTVGNFIFVYTQVELEEMVAEKGEKPTTRVFELNYISAQDAESYITPWLGDDGIVTASPVAASGISSGSDEGGGNAAATRDFLVVTAKPPVLAKVQRVIGELDIRPRQVLIEATILRADLKDDNALGIDFSIVGGVDLELLGSTSPGFAGITLGSLPPERFEQFNAVAATDFSKDVPSGGISFGIIKDNVAMFLRALETVTDTTVLANPKILALNKQKGQVIVGRRDGFVTTTVTETQAVQSVEFLETGTQLIFRPFISDDGWIRVELHPEDSVGFVNAQGLPSEQTTEVTTNVMIRDGQTIFIGGLFREVTTAAQKQVPGLGSVPLIGPLFRSNSDSTAREEVIILMTVHIVKDQDAFADASHEQLEHIERLRVGLRQGLMWHGRERLAQTHYRKALDALRAGDTSKALWHANLALHNNARMLPAMQLKEKLIGERLWDEDGTSERTFLHRLIAKERGYTGSLLGRPEPSLAKPTGAAAQEASHSGEMNVEEGSSER